MIKTLIVKETGKNIILKVEIARPGNKTVGSKDIARFAKSGMGYCALGAAGRLLCQSMGLDHIEYHGTLDTYRMLVGLGVLDPKRMPADAA
jgi:hypothetical protein